MSSPFVDSASIRTTAHAPAALAGSQRRAGLAAAVLLGVLCSMTSPVHADAEDDNVAWQPEWRRVNLFEGLALIPVGGLLWAIETQWPSPAEPRWQGGILGDDFARELLRGGSPGLQQTAAKVSDLLFIGGVVVPILVDIGITLAVHRSPDVAWQMFLIDMQSLFVAGLFSLSAEHGVGRARPFVEDCDEQGLVHDEQGRTYQHCGSKGDTKSFFSGHASATASVAGLTCIHHQHMPLYGGGLADLAPCLVTMAVSITTGMGRIIADRHWTSDVLLGWSVGALSGYFLPALIHYGWGRNPSRVRLTPVAAPGGFGLSMLGKWD